jgi:putative membrane protein
MKLFAAWLINAVSLLLVTHLLPGIAVRGLGTALVVALVLGLVNVLLRPVLMVLTLPVNILTLGLFTLVVNGFCFWLVAEVIRGFHVAGFVYAVLGAFVYSVISSVASSLLLDSD